MSWLGDKKYDYENRSEKKMDELKLSAQKEKYFSSVEPEFATLKKKLEDLKKQDLVQHHDEIKELLESEIVSRYYYQTGELESNFKYDNELKKAMEVLQNSKLYTSILNGEGTYKVIGKPGTTEQSLTGSESEDWLEKN